MKVSPEATSRRGAGFVAAATRTAAAETHATLTNRRPGARRRSDAPPAAWHADWASAIRSLMIRPLNVALARPTVPFGAPAIGQTRGGACHRAPMANGRWHFHVGRFRHWRETVRLQNLRNRRTGRRDARRS